MMSFLVKKQSLQNILSQSKSFSEYCSNYFAYLHDLLQQLDSKLLDHFISELHDTAKDDATIFVIGNGGSAATAAHMAQDWNFEARKKRGLPSFRIHALTTNLSEVTALSNDDHFENVFLQQLKIHYQKKDRLLAISASGNSENLIRAAAWVKSQGGKVLAFTGFDGGKLYQLADCAVQVDTPKGEYGPVEDIHMIMDHVVYSWLQYQNDKIFAAKNENTDFS